MEPSSDHGPRLALDLALAEFWDQFSLRQQQITDLMFQNLGQKEIAERLGIAEKTVHEHIRKGAKKVPDSLCSGKPSEKLRAVYIVKGGASTDGIHLKPPYRT